MRRGAAATRRWAALLVVFGTLALPGRAGASSNDEAALFESGAKALHEGRAADAISSFEDLADRGAVDPVLSFDRGLAYAMRVRIGAEVPGDLGRAAHGFEEARDLSRDPRLVEDASKALALVRSEVARRRVRAGEPVEVDPGRSLSRTLARLLAEDTWALLAVIASATFAFGLFVRWFARAHRMRIFGGVAAGVAVPVLAVATAMTLAARHDRTRVREAVVVVPNSRPSDARGITLPGATPLPEGSRVEVVDERGSWDHIRFGSIEAWMASNTLRELARAD
jgi:hypothetical protein